ncbi:uncharacterized protein LOC112531864 [Gallus gallus]|uniref:uncharacterized protein LOC112531864 n=1 Tax=Gallus gallus TaxID=9031 RepID=UPI001EFF7661|nr:uncharacterized protein LOC112531864 [Gallus gallus]XP_046784521.1 uncharacterized protein LOC112531864 [Gallus gallus]
MKLKLGLRPPCSRFNNCLLVYFNGDPPTARPPPPPLLPGGGPGGGRRGEAQGTPSAPGHGGGCCGRAPLWGPGRCSRGAAPLGARGQWQPSALRRKKRNNKITRLKEVRRSSMSSPSLKAGRSTPISLLRHWSNLFLMTCDEDITASQVPGPVGFLHLVKEKVFLTLNILLCLRPYATPFAMHTMCLCASQCAHPQQDGISLVRGQTCHSNLRFSDAHVSFH